MISEYKQFYDEAPLIFTLSEVLYQENGRPRDFQLVKANPAFEKVFGIRPEEVVGKNMSEWLFNSVESGGRWFSAFSELALSSGRKDFEEPLEIKGDYYIVTAFAPYKGFLGCLFHKATKFKEAKRRFEESEAQLAASQALSQSIFDNSPFGIITFTVLNKGRTLHDYIVHNINSTALRMQGWRKQQIIGKPLSSVRVGDTESPLLPVFQEVFKTGETKTGAIRFGSGKQDDRWYHNTAFKLPTREVVTVFYDITEQRQAEEKLRTERERLRVTLQSIGDGVIATDRNGRINLLNPVAEELTGWKLRQAAGLPLTTVFDIYNEGSETFVKDPASLVLQTGKTVTLANHTVLKAKDGEEREIADSAAPIKNAQGDIQGVVLVFRDVTEEKRRENRIRFLSYRDSLTELCNRACLEMNLQKLSKNGQNSYPVTLMMGDLDGLKLINDAFGHTVGDEALQKVAEAVRESCRPTDVIARWGGDEFVIVLPGTGALQAQAISERIRENCKRIKVADTHLSISLGYATKQNGEKETWEDLLKKAEDSMYRRKMLGAKSYRSIVLASMKNTLFEKSFETEEHGERLGGFCRRIGEALGLRQYRIDELQVLAMLHDIGKIAIDGSILRKCGPLTAAEWQEIRKHPEIGYRIAQTVPELVDIAEYILAHHERWDGNGYPRGLSGAEIPLASRILAIADAYDVITQGRPYRKARSGQDAQDELLKCAGAQFDPQIVDIFLKCINDRPSSAGTGGGELS